MAVLAAAALLDELMGRNRNIAPHEKGKELNWEDAEYCKFFMVKFCPHDLFVNTKADLGSCAKVHDEEARKLFDESKPMRKLQYQEEFIRFCSSMLNDVERKIIKGKQRLALSGKGVQPASEDGSTTPGGTATTPAAAPPHRNQEQIDLLSERINGLEEEAEQAGNQGNVEQAQGLMKLCDQLKEEKEQLLRPAYLTYPGAPGQHWTNTAELAAAQEKQMEVCEVCGAFLIVGDAQQRIEDHLTGKQHMGYARLKAAIDEIGTIVDEVRAKEDRHGGHRGGRGYGGGGGLDRGGGRDRRDRGRDRERSRSPQRDRDRKDREKERRSSGGGDRDRKSRDKDRERERESSSKRDKKDSEKDREKDRDRRHRSDRDSGRDSRSNSGHRHSSHRR